MMLPINCYLKKQKFSLSIICCFGAIIRCATSYSATHKIDMQIIRNDGQGGRGVILLPKNGAYTNVIFWFHGLGDTADGWAASMPSLGIPNTKFILPTASSRPISINGGMPMPGWSDIFGLEATSEEDKEGFTSSSNRVEQLLQRELDNGIPPSKIIVAGFSQGGALALHFSLRSKVALGGCIALSSWLPFRDDYPASLSPTAASLKIFQAHGDADNVVDHNWGFLSHSLLKTMIQQNEPKFLTIPRMGHSSSPHEMAAVSEFIKSIL